jgi:hypothetical protein
MKQCTKCKQTKPFDAFYKRKGAAALRRSRCIECTNSDEIEARTHSTYQRDYHAANRDRILLRKNTSRARIEIRAVAIHGQAKRRAKNTGANFDIPVAMIEVLLRIGTCQRSGIKFDLEKHEKLQINPFAPSLDRKDSFKGYTVDNVQLVCDMYNRGKSQNTDEDFIAFCKAVAEFNT